MDFDLKLGHPKNWTLSLSSGTQQNWTLSLCSDTKKWTLSLSRQTSTAHLTLQWQHLLYEMKVTHYVKLVYNVFRICL